MWHRDIMFIEKLALSGVFLDMIALIIVPCGLLAMLFMLACEWIHDEIEEARK